MDAYRFKVARSYPLCDGTATFDGQVRVGQDEAGTRATLASAGWTGYWNDVLGGAVGEATMRSDGSMWM